MTQPSRFVFLLLRDFTHLAFSCAIEPLRIANLVSGRDLYSWSLISENGQSETCSNGTVTLVQGGLGPVGPAERLFVMSGNHVQRHASAPILAMLRRERATGTPIGAVCSGAYVLARAGFLNGMEAAVHWAYHDFFAEAFPDVHLVRNVFVARERIITASGGTAAADLMLHLIGKQHGRDLAVAVADQMVYTAVREGSATQRLSLRSRHGMRNDHLIRAIARMEQCIEDPLPPSQIAEEVGISIRQLERLFMRYLGQTPKRYHMGMRLQRAENLIVQTERSIIDIAVACGFGSSAHFSRVSRAQYGRSPLAQRLACA